jgi:hypothetical protein
VISGEAVSGWEDMADTIAVHRNQIARAQGVQSVEHEEAERLLREAAAQATTTRGSGAPFGSQASRSIM